MTDALTDKAPKRRVRKDCDLSLAARAAWIVLRDEGGWWSPGELCSSLLPHANEANASKVAARWLSALHRRGHIARNPRAQRSASFGVTATCHPIPGHSLAPSTDQRQEQAATA